MSDLISRQAAIDIFDDYNISVENGELEAYSRDRKRLCELPSAQPEQRWIPCSERLPEDSSPVLVTHRGGVSYGWYNGTYFERGASTNHIKLQTVIAWMPLPEPYRKDGESDG